MADDTDWDAVAEMRAEEDAQRWADEHAPDPGRWRIYLAGPMRGIAEFNCPAFREGARLLRAAGHEVFSPAEHDGFMGFDWCGHTGDLSAAEAAGFSLRAALGADLAWITAHADAVVVLPGWEKSAGARAETATATALGLPVCEIGPFLAGETGAQADPPPLVAADLESRIADLENTIGQATMMAESMAEGGQISPDCARRLLSTLGDDSARDAEQFIRNRDARVPGTEVGISLIAAERARQVAVEGYTPEHDATHDRGQLALAAGAYALAASGRAPQGAVWWPFDDWDFKPGPKPLDDLVKAGALIAAEIDRIVTEEARRG